MGAPRDHVLDTAQPQGRHPGRGGGSGRDAALRTLGLALAIGLAGLASTAVRVELLPGMHLVAIPAAPLLAAVLLGPAGGAVAGAVAGLGTVLLWDHGYALSLLVLEGVGVGVLRRRLSPVVADGAYWAIAGAWAALVVYGTPLGLDFVWPAAFSATLKVGANSLLAALAVHVVLLLPPVRARLEPLLPLPLTRSSVRVMLRLVLACVAVLPLSTVAVLQAHHLLSSERARLAETNTRTARDVAHRLERELRETVEATQALAGTLRARDEAGAPPATAEELGRWIRARVAVSPVLSGMVVLEAPGGDLLAYTVRPPATPSALALALNAVGRDTPPGLVQVGGMLLAATWVRGGQPGAIDRLVIASVDLEQLAAEAVPLLEDGQRLAVLGPDGRPAIEAPMDVQRLDPDSPLTALLRNLPEQESGALADPGARSAVLEALGRLHFGAAPLRSLGWRVVVATPEAALLPGLHDQLGRMLLGLLGALLLALVGGEVLGRLITRPLGELAAVAGRVALGERQVRAGRAVTHGPQEVAVVGRAFEAMTNALAEQLETQQRAHARLQAALEGSGAAVFEVGLDWRFLYVNRAAEPLLRRRREELLGRVLWEEFPETVGSEYWVQYRRAVQEGVSVQFEAYYPPLQLWTQVRAHPSPIGLSIFFLDITHLKRAEQALQEAVRARDEFLSVASHELRTPLTSLTLQLEVVRRRMAREATDSAMARGLAGIVRHVGRLTALVEGLLDVSRLATGRMQLRLADENLGELTRAVVERMQPMLSQAGCELHLIVDGVVHSRVDAFRLEQVLTNLLSNAAKYGAGKPVEVRVEDDGACARLTVRDEGIGIAPDAQRRIFGRFERAVSERNYGGMGLGLYISHQVVEALGGTIAVHSAPGEGASFTVTLPHEPDLRASRENAPEVHAAR